MCENYTLHSQVYASVLPYEAAAEICGGRLPDYIPKVNTYSLCPSQFASLSFLVYPANFTPFLFSVIVLIFFF